MDPSVRRLGVEPQLWVRDPRDLQGDVRLGAPRRPAQRRSGREGRRCRFGYSAPVPGSGTNNAGNFDYDRPGNYDQPGYVNGSNYNPSGGRYLG
jgi:hypothetical protein